MKRFSKEMQSRPSALQKVFYRRDDVKDFNLTESNKAAECSNTQTAQHNIFKPDFTQIIARLKAICFRVAAWLSVVGSPLC